METIDIAIKVLTLFLLGYVAFFMLFKKGYISEKGKIAAKIESDIIQNLYERVGEIRITFADIDERLRLKDPSEPVANEDFSLLEDKLNTNIRKFRGILFTHRNTYLCKYKGEIDSFAKEYNKYLEAVKNNDNKAYRDNRVNHILEKLLERIYKDRRMR